MNPYSFISPIRPYNEVTHHEARPNVGGPNWLDSALSRSTYWLVQTVSTHFPHRNR